MLYFFLLFTKLIYAQVAAPDCNPIELERQCFAQVCSTELQTLSLETIQASFEAGHERMSPQLEENFRNFSEQTLSSAERVNGLLTTLNPAALAQELISDQTFQGGDLETFFRFMEPNVGFKFFGQEGIYVDDMSPDVETYKKLSNFFWTAHSIEDGLSTLRYMGTSKLTLSGMSPKQKELVTYILDRMIYDSQNNPVALAQYQRVKQDYSQNRRLSPRVISNLFGAAQMKAMRANVFRPEEENIRNAVSARIRAYQETNWQEKLNGILQSCRVYSHLQETIRASQSREQFPATVTRTLNDFETRFYPLLSESTRRHISGNIRREDIIFEEDPQTRNPFEVSRDPGTGLASQITNLKFRSDVSCGNGRGRGSVYHNDDKRVRISEFDLALAGPGVLYHELGHRISALMAEEGASSESKNRFLALRACLSSMHGELPGNPKFAGDQLYTEEDYADWVAAKASATPLRTFCSLQMLLGSPTRSMYDSRKSDCHSNELFRHLHVMLNQNQTLPGPCRDLISSRPEQPRACEL